MTKPSRVRPCGVCGHATRPGRTSVADFPGTRSRGDKDTCRACYERARRERDREARAQETGESARLARLLSERRRARHARHVVYPPGGAGRFPWICRHCRTGGAPYLPELRDQQVAVHIEEALTNQKEDQ